MPTITNFGDLVVAGNMYLSGTGTSTFSGGVSSSKGFSATATSGFMTASYFTGGAFVGASMNVSGTSNLITANILTANVTNLFVSGMTSNTTNTVFTSTINFNSLLVNSSPGSVNQTIITTGTGAGVQWGTIVGSQWTTTASDIYYTAGKVGVGIAGPQYPFHVAGTAQTKAAPYSNLALQSGGYLQAYQPSTAQSLKIFTDGNIGCAELDVFSDERIKDNIQTSGTQRNMDIIKNLRVVDYNYKDVLEHGSQTYTGLVAQEVKGVFEEAVRLHMGTIPDIFQVPSSREGSIVKFSNPLPVELCVGDSVRVLDEDLERTLRVLRVADRELEFSEPLIGSKIFVYGRLVNDLHTVSYDRLVPVLISAVQELMKKLETN